MLFRAIGDEGLAQNVDGPSASSVASSIKNSDHHNILHTYHTEYQTVPCIDTSGQTFAIWLNVLYLAPLTVLFIRFFVKSYLRRSGKGSTYSTTAEKAELAGKDALKGVGRELYTNGTPKKSKVNGVANGHSKAPASPGNHSPASARRRG